MYRNVLFSVTNCDELWAVFNPKQELLQSNVITTTSLKTIEIGDDEQLFKENEQQKEEFKNQTQTNLLSSTVSLNELDANMFRFPRTTIM